MSEKLSEAAYRVKPLKWVKVKGQWWSAASLFGDYRAYNDGWFCPIPAAFKVAATLDEAKLAAEAHYRERLLAALEPSLVMIQPESEPSGGKWSMVDESVAAAQSSKKQTAFAKLLESNPELAARYDATVAELRDAANKELEAVERSEQLTSSDFAIYINARADSSREASGRPAVGSRQGI